MQRSFYTTTEAAGVLGISSARVRQMILDGTMVADKVGRDLLISSDVIEQAKGRNTRPGRPPKVEGVEAARTAAAPAEKAAKRKAKKASKKAQPLKKGSDR